MPAMFKANERCYNRTFGLYGLETFNHPSELKILWDTFRSQIAEVWFPYDRFIEQVLAGLNGTCVIMADLLVGSVNDDEHLRNLEAVFQQFQNYGLRVKLPKCAFMAPSVMYFGLLFGERNSSS